MTFGEWDTRAAEFGISCEACHGPGQQHIAYHRDSAVNKDTAASLSSDLDRESRELIACPIVASLWSMSLCADPEGRPEQNQR